MTTIKLSKPINFEGRTYEKFEIDGLSLGAIEALERATKDGAGDVGATIAMLAVVADWPLDVVRKITITDLEKINEVVVPLVEKLKPKAPPTGEQSPQT